jgi:hypothetical protein
VRVASAVIMVAAAPRGAGVRERRGGHGGADGRADAADRGRRELLGSIVAQLAGKAGSVTSIVTDPKADPHDYGEFEQLQNARNAKALAG